MSLSREWNLRVTEEGLTLILGILEREGEPVTWALSEVQPEAPRGHIQPDGRLKECAEADCWCHMAAARYGPEHVVQPEGEREYPKPKLPLFSSGDPTLAERVAEGEPEAADISYRQSAAAPVLDASQLERQIGGRKLRICDDGSYALTGAGAQDVRAFNAQIKAVAQLLYNRDYRPKPWAEISERSRGIYSSAAREILEAAALAARSTDG